MSINTNFLKQSIVFFEKFNSIVSISLSIFTESTSHKATEEHSRKQKK